MKGLLERCYSLCESCKGRRDGYEPLVQNFLEDLLHGEYGCRDGCLDFAEKKEGACLECVSSWLGALDGEK